MVKEARNKLYTIIPIFSYAITNNLAFNKSFHFLYNRHREGEEKMIRIMLCCASGMSTSLLVEKMKKAALEQGIEAEIWAVGANEVKANANRTDIILLGPQVRYAQRKIESEAPGVPVAHIDMKDYGMMNGQSVLKQALAILEKNQ